MRDGPSRRRHLEQGSMNLPIVAPGEGGRGLPMGGMVRRSSSSLDEALADTVEEERRHPVSRKSATGRALGQRGATDWPNYVHASRIRARGCVVGSRFRWVVVAVSCGVRRRGPVGWTTMSRLGGGATCVEVWEQSDERRCWSLSGSKRWREERCVWMEKIRQRIRP
jgi:hypothetical protein